MNNNGKTLVTVATYNEIENLPLLVDAIFEQLPDADLLVIDDNSPDGTGQWCDQKASEDARVRCLHREGKLGLGTATIAGMKYGIEHGYKYVLNLDADFSHHPRYLPAMLRGMEEGDPPVDVMIGSRYVPGGGTEGWPLKRRMMSKGVNLYARLMLGLKPKDCSGAFRCFRVAKLKEVDFSRVYSKGYSFQEEFLYHCQRAGCRIGETPIVFEDRVRGQSKINRKEAVTALWALLYTAVRR